MATRFRRCWLFAALSLILMPLSAWAQNCTPNDIILNTQLAVDNFQTDHGPCDTILNKLVVSGADITNLNGLAGVVSVGTDIELLNNPVLADVSGLANITSTGNRVTISNNTVLASLPLTALATIGTDLELLGNPALADVSGLGNVSSTGNRVTISNNAVLASLPLTSLVTVGTDLELLNNPMLTDLSGLASVASTGNRATIQNNATLGSLNGLNALIAVGTDLQLNNNAALADCSALATLVDDVDDGAPGPGPGGAGIPDIGANVSISGNLLGCNSVAQILGGSDLALTVSGTPDVVLAGSGATVEHTIAVENLGPVDATGATVTITQTLPAGVTIQSVSGDGSWNSPPTTWTPGALVVGGTASLLLTLAVDSTAQTCSDCITTAATANAPDDLNPDNNTGSVSASIETAAAAPTGFMTTVTFSNGYAGTIGVTLDCNNGVPLQQSKDISAASGVNFVVASLDFVAPATECEISVDVESGYTASVLANGVDTGSSCLFSASPAAGEAPFDLTLARANTCEITAEPVQSQFIVHKDWVTYDDGNTEQTGSLHVWCTPAAVDTGNQFGTVEDTFDLDGNGTFYLDFYPAPGGATCYAEEDVDSSAVESSSTCAGGVPFAVGDVAKTCAITNTVFFEGIPTLSQYGLAILALLMLGIGFVGLRRFV